MKQVVINIDCDTHRDFKEWCARNKTSLKDIVTEFIENRIKEDKKE